MNAAIFKSAMKQLMQRAWEFVKKFGMTIAVAMKKAWMIFKLKIRMKKEVISFSYLKKDGSLRKAIGTLIDSMLPEVTHDIPCPVGNMRYFDTERKEWRSFILKNIVSVG